MITQELIAYVKSEVNKGRTREEIRATLLKGGGWSEQDISEVFRTVIPMETTPLQQPAVAPKEPILAPKEASPVFSLNRDLASPTPSLSTPHVASAPRVMEVEHQAKESHKMTMFLALMFGALLFVAIYFYGPELSRMSKSLMGVLDSVSTSVGGLFDKKEAPQQPNIETTPVVPVEQNPVVKQKVNCGVTKSPDRKNPALYTKDQVLKCLGENAAACNPAEAIINDELFPTIFRITADNNLCKFELAYRNDSTLTDVHSKKLAGRSIVCPISVTKTIDETDPVRPVFKPADPLNGSKYAADMYFYGTLGVFIEQNFNLGKINAIGCGGEFINSVIESYNMMQSQR